MRRRRERINAKEIENIIEARKQVKKLTIINCQRLAGIINSRFSFSKIKNKEEKQKTKIGCYFKKNE